LTEFIYYITITELCTYGLIPKTSDYIFSIYY